MVVWSGLWFWYLARNPPDSSLVWYLCSGLMLTGITLVVIGLGLGQIGWSARHADLPPEGLVPPTNVTPPGTLRTPPPVAPPIIIAAPPGTAVPAGGTVATGPAATSSDVSPPDRVDEEPRAAS
jgi:hypothetical protein